MKRPLRFLIGIGAVILVGAGVMFLAPRPSPLAPSRISKVGTYYCPMHPTYTSDRPGDCPICFMKLVKRQSEPAVSPMTPAPKAAKDICYLHNCPMVHQGKPCPMLVVAKEGEEVTCPVCGKHVAKKLPRSSGKKILYWTDPMIPGYKSDKPGRSPMGMDLVPVYEEKAGVTTDTAPVGYSPVLLSQQKQQLIGVKTAAVERRPLTKTIRTVGTVAHDPELYQAQAEYLQAVQSLAQARAGGLPEVIAQAERLVESSTIRLRHLGISDELVQEMAAWKEPERGLLYAQPGEPVWAYAKIYEYERPLVHVGQTVTAEAAALPGETFTGEVRAIDPMVDPMTRTIRLRAKLDDPKGLLKPETYLDVSLAVELGEVVAVPEEAVFDTGTQRIVFVDRGQGVFDPRDVTVGANADGAYELKAGVAEGERVVTSGNFLIDSESRLKAAIEGMAGGEHHHGQ